MSVSPALSHISKQDRKEVYPPSVDTFLLLDSIANDRAFLQQHQPALVLEVGVGCGAVLASVATLFGPQAMFLGLDINQAACVLAQRTLAENQAPLADLAVADLYKGFNLTGKVDVLICNPPYVITSAEEYEECQQRKDLSSSFAGGEDGRQFINLLIEHKHVLADSGVVYLLFEEHNGAFGGVPLSETRSGCEGLSVVRLTKEEFRFLE